MLPLDTRPEARAVHLEVLRKLGAERRLLLALQFSEDLRDVTCAGIRARHPEYDDRQVDLALWKLTLGSSEYRRLFPDDRIDP